MWRHGRRHSRSHDGGLSPTLIGGNGIVMRKRKGRGKIGGEDGHVHAPSPLAPRWIAGPESTQPTTSTNTDFLPSSPALTLNTAHAPPGDHSIILTMFARETRRVCATLCCANHTHSHGAFGLTMVVAMFSLSQSLEIFLAPPAHGAMRPVPASGCVAVPLSKTLSANGAPATANRSWAP